MTTFKVGDYAETDRHYGRIVWEFDYGDSRVLYAADPRGKWLQLERLECLHGPQKRECTHFERLFSTQLRHAPSPEELEDMIYVS